MSNSTLFQDLAVGDTFRWRSNLGAGDTLRKTSDDTTRNITLSSRENRALYPFSRLDAVTVISRAPEPAKPTIAERQAQLAALPASDLVAEYARTYYCAGQTPTAQVALWTILRGEYGADESGAMERELGRQEGAQHTPGPWSVMDVADLGDIHNHRRLTVWAGKEKCVADCERRSFGFIGNPGETTANARLIAAAPDLLAACQSFTAMYRQGIVGTQLDAAYHAMTAAIAKATLSTVGIITARGGK